MMFAHSTKLFYCKHSLPLIYGKSDSCVKCCCINKTGNMTHCVSENNMVD